jgi:hypothetical protein
MYPRAVGVGVLFVAALSGCGAGHRVGGDVGVDADAGPDSDADADSDADGDTDTDTGSDTGSDTDSGTESGIEPEDPHDCDHVADVAPISDAWTITDVGPYGGSSNGDVAVDADDVTHLVFTRWDIDTETVDLRYATNETGSFVDTVLQSEFTHGYATGVRIDLDSAGGAHLAWPGFTDWTLYHGVDDAGWSFEAITALQSGHDIAVGSDDVIHVTYVAPAAGGLFSLFYANDVTDWDPVEITWTGIGGNSATTSCPDGSVHVVYDRCVGAKGDPCDAVGVWDEPFQLVYATNESGAWTIEPIAWDVTAWRSSAIACDADGVLQVAWANGNHVRYATRVGEDWEIEWIDRMCGTGSGGLDLAVDSAGAPHVVYENAGSDRGTLRYATRAGGIWSLEIVDAETIGQSYPRIALDSGDVPHLIYDFRDGFDSRFRYAER